MAEKPTISKGEWIYVGEQGKNTISAVVSEIFNDGDADCEVVHLDAQDPDRSVNRDVKWNGSFWEFVDREAGVGDADRYDRLRPYVDILKNGRCRKY